MGIRDVFNGEGSKKSKIKIDPHLIMVQKAKGEIVKQDGEKKAGLERYLGGLVEEMEEELQRE